MTTPEERAYADALAAAVGSGVHGDEAVAHADAMRKTLWFATTRLHYAVQDLLTPLLAPLERAAGWLSRRLR